jgi:adenosylcobyric acid synthase
MDLPSEDSLGLPPAVKKLVHEEGKINVGIVRLPKISNFTDFDPLMKENDLKVSYLDNPAHINELDLLIIPGTKSTAQDMQWLDNTGLAKAIKEFNGMVIGICGGFQILGSQIKDPFAVESQISSLPGLAMLPVVTELTQAKATRLATCSPATGASALFPEWQHPVQGYEIHMGVSKIVGDALPFAMLNASTGGKTDSWDDGAITVDGRIFGTYLHGLFDDQHLRNAIFYGLRKSKGLAQPIDSIAPDDPYDRLAAHLEAHIDMARLWTICGLN